MHIEENGAMSRYRVTSRKLNSSSRDSSPDLFKEF